jgi:hypothetical protein
MKISEVVMIETVNIRDLSKDIIRLNLVDQILNLLKTKHGIS